MQLHSVNVNTTLFWRKKKSCREMRREKNILQTVWEGKKFPAHLVARKKKSC